MRCPERTSLDRIKLTQWSVLSLKPSVADGVIISALHLIVLNHFCLLLPCIPHMHNVMRARWCPVANRNALTSLKRVSKPKNIVLCYGYPTWEVGLGKSFMLEFSFAVSTFSSSQADVALGCTRQTCQSSRCAWTVACRRPAGMVVFCVFCCACDPSSSSPFGSQEIFQKYFLPVQIWVEVCIINFFSSLRK